MYEACAGEQAVMSALWANGCLGGLSETTRIQHASYANSKRVACRKHCPHLVALLLSKPHNLVLD